MNLHQLRIFCAIAQSATLTQAAKQLGLAQPTLSQQLSKLEQKIGAKLFDRGLNQMELTNAGRYLLRRAQIILHEVDEAQSALKEFASGTRGIIRLAGLNSIIREVVPLAIDRLNSQFPEVEFDLHEMSPTEVLDLLYTRQVNIGLVAANTVSISSGSFKEFPVVRDPYVFAVPAGIDLAGIADPDADLSPEQRKIVNSCIRFNFASQHSRQVEYWYQEMLPSHRLFAQCRSYEVALSMVRTGLGVCLLPALAVYDNCCGSGGMKLYATDRPDRQTVAVVPSQYQRIEPYGSFLEALRQAGSAVRMPPILPMPPFIARAGDKSSRL
jgi:DNA-binding transcriptional LysR family regulator